MRARRGAASELRRGLARQSSEANARSPVHLLLSLDDGVLAYSAKLTRLVAYKNASKSWARTP